MDLHGYDPNALAITYADAALRARGISATLHDAATTIGDGSMGCVICTEVIEHASAPGELLQTIARMLKPGGRLVMTTPPLDGGAWRFESCAGMVPDGICEAV
jgi:2-polyprenyl-3-methyl-5-hydroxy-6-metoxy-1,4-benzoquinol methylase